MSSSINQKTKISLSVVLIIIGAAIAYGVMITDIAYMKQEIEELKDAFIEFRTEAIEYKIMLNPKNE